MGAGGAADFTAEAKFGADWILRMWDDPSRTLYYQVGIGGGNAKTISDHDIWRLPQADDTFGGTDPLYRYIRNRPVFRAGAPGSLISPNLAGRTSAALALAYQVFRTSDATFANKALVAAAHIFDLANTNPGQLTTAIPFEFYPETEWRDDLELGAVELHRALVAAGGSPPAGLPHTDPRFYLDACGDVGERLHHRPQRRRRHAEPVRRERPRPLRARPGDDRGRRPGRPRHDPRRAPRRPEEGARRALAQGATDPFGFGFPWNVWDTTTHGAGLSVMASEYDQLTGTSTYAAQADRWLANVLGANAWGLSLIVGTGSNFPKCIQHQLANISGSLDGSAPVLAGAAVEGPNGGATTGSLSGMRACPANGVDAYAPFNGKTAQFKDNVESYSNTEPAIDLTATSPLAFARQAAGIR
jgi:endoglucanase